MPQPGDDYRLKRFELVYDYIKFHIGLYIGTPPVIAILGESFKINTQTPFRVCLGGMIVIYLFSGFHAAWFMSTYINQEWKDKERFLEEFEGAAYKLDRRIWHHYLYWLGLGIGLLGLLLGKILCAAKIFCSPSPTSPC